MFTVNLVSDNNPNLLFNGDFEETIKRTVKNKHPHNFTSKTSFLMPLPKNSPAGKGPAIYTGKKGHYAYFSDDKTERSGNYSICITNVNPDRTGIASVNWNQVPIETNTKYTLAGWVKAENATDIKVYTSITGQKKHMKYVKFIGEDSFDWKPFVIEIDTSQKKLDFQSEYINIKLINSGTGTVWFDNIYLEKNM